MPGPRWHLPYPIESAEVVNLLGVRTVEVGYRNNVKSKVLKESLMLTDDENIIDVQFAVQYVLKSPNDYLFNSREPDEIGAAGRRDRDARGRGQEQHGFRAVRRPRPKSRRARTSSCRRSSTATAPASA